PGHTHGGPPSALITRAVEHHEPDPGLALSRIVFDLVRPVPLAPLRVTTSTARPGQRVQIVEACLTSADGVDLVRARALRVRRTPDTVSSQAPPIEPLGFVGPADAAPDAREGPFRPGITRGMELRAAVGTFDAPGPATYWFRLRVPLVDGEEPTPAQRAVMAADFGNGISQVLDQRYVFINPDLIVHLEREPVGEWIALAATTRIVPGAGAVAAGVLHDERGRFGQSEQSLYIAARD
ncbi:MAG: thioesterase family protein, partial [Acidimicrobiia bacterium]